MKKIIVTLIIILSASGVFCARQITVLNTSVGDKTFLISNTEKLALKYTRHYKTDVGQADIGN